ncbi:MAG: hypothetical protein HYX48_03450 [Chlamydiales bacterium]|nr:hypothetical protein [Chlamydiales bacterium]
MKIDTNTSAAPVAPSESPNNQGSIWAICELLTLLSTAMKENVLSQGKAATDMSNAVHQTSDLMATYNKTVGVIASQIQDLTDKMSALRPWMTALMVIGIVLGGAGALATGTAVGAGVVGSLGSAAAVAGGSVGVVEGSYSLQVGQLSEELAHQNGVLAGLNGAQQNYQSFNKNMSDQISGTFTNLNDLTKGVTSGIKGIYDGVSRAGSDMLRGVLS